MSDPCPGPWRPIARTVEDPLLELAMAVAEAILARTDADRRRMLRRPWTVPVLVTPSDGKGDRYRLRLTLDLIPEDDDALLAALEPASPSLH